MSPVTLALLALAASPAWGGVVINEVSPLPLGGKDWDWVELVVTGAAPENLAQYALSDSQLIPQTLTGTSAPEALSPGSSVVVPMGPNKLPGAVRYGLSRCDSVVLWKDNVEVDRLDFCPTYEDPEEFTYSRIPDGTGDFAWGLPTPGVANTAAPSKYPKPSDLFGNDEIMTLKITMAPEDYAYMWDNSSFELYRPARISVSLPNNAHMGFGRKLMAHAVAPAYELEGPIAIRPRGFSTLYFPECQGYRWIPFLLDFNKYTKGQTLFGVRKAYLRNNMHDNSLLREWSMMKWLKKFGLPHMNVKMTEVYLNEEYLGVYLFMESPDEKKVIQRNFPESNLDLVQLYKVKVFGGPGLAGRCDFNGFMQTQGKSTDEIEDMLVETGMFDSEAAKFNASGDPSHSMRGEHLKKTQVRYDQGTCGGTFLFDKFMPVLKEYAYKFHPVYKGKCGDMMVEEKWIDRDVGSGSHDKMKALIDLVAAPTNPSTEEFAKHVDVDSWLKNFATMAVIMSQDSPLGNGNNWYMFDAADGKGWKIWQYDHNNYGLWMSEPDEGSGMRRCSYPRQMHSWSILRATAKRFKDHNLAGPLLSDPGMQKKFVTYIEEFLPIYRDTTFIKEMAERLRAGPLQRYSKVRGMEHIEKMFGRQYRSEVDMSGDFLPQIASRSENIAEQLAFIKENECSVIDEDLKCTGPKPVRNHDSWHSCPDLPMKPLPPKPAQGSCDSGWSEFGTSCYKLFENQIPWKLAQMACQAHDGDLASAASKEENDFINQICSKNTCWIGLYETPGAEGDYRWPDGSKPKYTNWQPGEPNNHGGQNENAVFMNLGDLVPGFEAPYDGTWFDAGEMSSFVFVCEKDPPPPTTATSPKEAATKDADVGQRQAPLPVLLLGLLGPFIVGLETIGSHYQHSELSS